MDLVIRTPHGDADVRVGPTRRTTRVADVIEVVTGRVAPPVVEVDGRAVPAATSLVDAGVLNGSVVDVGPTREPLHGAVVDLVQRAGWGTGERASLTAGTYRIGPGRRVNAPELAIAPVDSVAFELTVRDDGTCTVRADGPAVRVDGTTLPPTAEVPWSDGVLDVASRAFTVGTHRRDPPTRPRATATDGTVAFNRPPLAPLPDPLAAGDASAAEDEQPAGRPGRARRRTSTDVRVAPGLAPAQRARRDAVVDPADALDDARAAAARLWRHRVGRPGALQVGVGIGDVTDERGRIVPAVPVVVDLGTEQGIAYVGGSDFVRAAARAAIIGLTTGQGPSDLALVVATHPDRVGIWEWVKWLPHVRTTGTIDVVTTADAVAAAVAVGARPSATTVVVVDEPAWWRDRAAPLRPLLTGPQSTVRVVALVADADEAPTLCTTLVVERSDAGAAPGQAVVEHLLERRCVDPVSTFLLSDGLANDAARGLAALDDPDLPEPARDPAHRRTSLVDVVLRHPTMRAPIDDVPSTDHLAAMIVERWQGQRSPDPVAQVVVPVPVGRDAADVVAVELGGVTDHLVVAGPEAPDVVRAAVTAACCDTGTERLGLVLIGPASTFGPCGELPHVAGAVAHPDEHEATRALRCLRAEARRRRAAGADEGALLVVLDEPSARDVHGFADAVAEIAANVPGMHLVVLTDRPSDAFADRLAPERTARFEVASGFGELTTRPMSRSRLLLPDGSAREVDPVTSRPARGWLPADGPDVQPFVIGRELTTLERRLARGHTDPTGPTQHLDAVVAAISTAARRTRRAPRRRCIPPPLPDRIELDVLAADHPGDAVPWAIADQPDEQRLATRWWFPSAGPSANVLVVGGRGPAAAWPVTCLALGIAARASADDVHLYVVAAGEARLGPLAGLHHVGAVVEGHDLEQVVALLGHLAAEVARRRERAAESAGPAHVLTTSPGIALLIDDLGSVRARLRARADLADAWDDLEFVLHAGAPLGVNVVATLRSADEVPTGTDAAFAARYVSAGGATDPPGRVVELGEQPCDVQLAEPPGDLRAAVAALGTEPARARPPVTTFDAWRRRDPRTRNGGE